MCYIIYLYLHSSRLVYYSSLNPSLFGEKWLGLACEARAYHTQQSDSTIYGGTLQDRASRLFIGFWTAFRVSIYTFLCYMTSPHLKSSPMQVLWHCICNQILKTIKVLEMRLMGKYVNFQYSQTMELSSVPRSSCQAAGIGKLLEPLSQLWLVTVALGGPFTHFIMTVGQSCRPDSHVGESPTRLSVKVDQRISFVN